MRLTRTLHLLVAAISLLAAPQNRNSGGAEVRKTSPAKAATSIEWNPDSKPAAGKLIEIDSASTGQLDAIPGIGKTYSAAIIKNGSYRAKNDLLDKKNVPAAAYAKIKDLIIANQNQGPWPLPRTQ